MMSYVNESHGWDTKQLEEDWYNPYRLEHTYPYDEFDPNPEATLEQDANYILKQQILKEFEEVRNSLPANLTPLERAETLHKYSRYKGLVILGRERLYDCNTYLAEKEEYLTKEELDAFNADLKERLHRARQKYLLTHNRPTKL
jgi:hypothetical protein